MLKSLCFVFQYEVPSFLQIVFSRLFPPNLVINRPLFSVILEGWRCKFPFIFILSGFGLIPFSSGKIKGIHLL